MNVNKDVKGWIALGLLVLGTICTILALSTNHWYDFKMTVDEYSEENYHTPGIDAHDYFGLWKVCASVKIRATPGVTQGLKLSKCFNVNDWKGVINYYTKLGNVAAETGFGDNRFQDTYSDTYDNDRFDDTDNNLGKMDNIFGEITRRRKRRSVNGLLSDSGDLEKFKKMLYPDYLKSIQALGILALLSGVTAIGMWLAYIVMSTRTRKGVASTVFKIIAIVLIIITAVFHVIGVVVWFVKKYKEISDALELTDTKKLPEGMDAYFGWSWGMAIAAAVLHLMSIIPVALAKANQPDDMTERVLPPSRVWTTPDSRDGY